MAINKPWKVTERDKHLHGVFWGLVVLVGCEVQAGLPKTERAVPSGVNNPEISIQTSAAERVDSTFCKAMPVRTDALDKPGKHAWDLFMLLNHPAVDENIERGKPDCSVPLGQPGRTSVWETWRNADTEVYLKDGSEPPDWNDSSLPDAKPGQVGMNSMAATQRSSDESATKSDLLTIASFHDLAKKGDLRFSPEDGVFQGEGGFGETRMNRATYDFIKENCLWSKEGMQRYARAIVDGKKQPISFPVDSIEVKAAWIDLQEAGIAADKQATYYIAQHEGKTYGLVALHVITKDIPNWFWATFHHKDAPENDFDDPDALAPPSELKGTVWENYRLGGTQVDFVSPTGEPTILSDHYVEFGFQRSSCITCHATAVMSPDLSVGPSQPMALCILNGSLPAVGLSAQICKRLVGEHLYRPGEDKLWHEHGTPLASWFKKGDKPFYSQVDFVWSIPFRASAEKVKPPQRCIW